MEGANLEAARRNHSYDLYPALSHFHSILGARCFSRTRRFVTIREAHLLISAVVMLAGSAWANSRVHDVAGGSRFGLGIYDAGRFVARETSPSNVQLSYYLRAISTVSIRTVIESLS